MPNPVYECPHCDYKASHQYIVGHIMANHADTFKSEVLRVGAKGKPTTTHLKLEGSRDLVYCCMGCKKFWGRKALADKHFTECTKKEEHKKWCSDNSGPQIEATSDNSELLAQFAKLQAENEKLRKKIERLEKDAVTAEKESKQLDKLIDGLRNVYDEDTRNDLCEKLNEREDEDADEKIDWFNII